jgi:hypothetical protein
MIQQAANSTKELADDIYRRRVLQARRMPPEEKLLAGARLFDYACGITLQGIRNEHPGIDEAGALAILRRRLELRSRREERGIYRDAGEVA